MPSCCRCWRKSWPVQAESCYNLGSAGLQLRNIHDALTTHCSLLITHH
jgi:hypothetical protein